jgi:hypothetical protein
MEIIIARLVGNTGIHCVGRRQNFLMLQQMVNKYTTGPEAVNFPTYTL